MESLTYCAHGKVLMSIKLLIIIFFPGLRQRAWYLVRSQAGMEKRVERGFAVHGFTKH